jgi:hypothetical protein
VVRLDINTTRPADGVSREDLARAGEIRDRRLGAELLAARRALRPLPDLGTAVPGCTPVVEWRVPQGPDHAGIVSAVR